ncbi:MAG: polyprenyl synthetase family protein [Thermomicrobiales bacterium]|nr:polyprenyl synthetase family protein [Thermomicrobiales bacterium]
MRADMERVNTRVLQVAQVDYPAASALVNDIVAAGGKRLRPMVLLLSGRAFDYEQGFDRLVTAAAGVELLHTASLIHDDTVDRSALRRGKPTLNSVLSAGATILIGDYLFAQSAMLAAATDSVRVVAIFASTLGSICDGQLREMFHAHRLDQTRQDYDLRIYGKTASLFAGAAEMGAVLGNAPELQIQALRGFGSDIGMAFQVVDDLLDVTGGTKDLGKPAGNDLRQGTVTLPTLLYGGRLVQGSKEWSRLERVARGEVNDPSDYDDVIAAIRSSGAIEETYSIAEEFVSHAKQRLNDLPDIETRELLFEIADIALGRVS